MKTKDAETWRPEQEKEEGSPQEGGEGRAQDPQRSRRRQQVHLGGRRRRNLLERCHHEKIKPIKSLVNVLRGD